MLRDFEKTAVYGLLVRQLEAEDAQEHAEEEIKRLSQTLADAKNARAAIRKTLQMFGFDMSVDSPWQAVKDEIGQDLWEQAFLLVRPNTPQLQKANEQPAPEAEDDARQSSEPSDASVNIRDMVVDKLKGEYPNGLKAAAIRDHISKQGIEMHEKTVGMTLYRLSKEGIARRDGYSWFYVPEAQRKEPSDDSSGQEASEGSVDQSQAQGREAGPGGGG